MWEKNGNAGAGHVRCRSCSVNHIAISLRIYIRVCLTWSVDHAGPSSFRLVNNSKVLVTMGERRVRCMEYSKILRPLWRGVPIALKRDAINVWSECCVRVPAKETVAGIRRCARGEKTQNARSEENACFHE